MDEQNTIPDQVRDDKRIKLFFKKWPQRGPFGLAFWIIIFVIVAGLFAYAWVSGHKQGKNEKKDEVVTDGKVPVNGGYSGNIFSNDLPTCPADLTGVFTHEVFDLADVDQVMPLGMLAPGGHTVPTDHMNIAHLGQKRIAIYAPGDVTLTFMDDKVTHDAKTDQILHDDYSVEIAPCKGISVWLNHFVEIEPKIKEAFEAQKKQCDTGKYHFGDDMTSYYQPCQTKMNVKFKAGELMGYVGHFAGGITTLATGIDFGAYNFNTAPHAFANPSRYEGGNLYSFCGIDLFSQPIKDAYYAKLGDIATNGSSGVLVPRVGEPKCGSDMQDVPGTLAGNWFAGSGNNGAGVTRNQYMLALVHPVSNGNLHEISLQGQPELGGNSATKFTPQHSGIINREWSEVIPGDVVYCYQADEANAKLGVGKDGKTMEQSDIAKFLIKLVDATHLQIEKQSGACSGNEKFGNPFTYER